MNEIKLRRTQPDRCWAHPTWVKDEAPIDWNCRSMLCGETVAQLVKIPKRVLNLVVVFHSQAVPNGWKFKLNTGSDKWCNPVRIIGTGCAPLYHGMDKALRQAANDGNTHFTLEYE